MIGKLKGILEEIGDDMIILDVNGVGYEVSCSSRTLQSLPPKGDPLTLYIETHVRETEIRLFGFTTEFGRVWFRKLQSVQGVGAKVALAILGTLNADDLANAITLGDKAMVSQAPGVGPKVAARICQELKDKIPVPATLDGRASASSVPLPVSAGEVNSGTRQDAISALTNLGYQPLAASQAVAKAMMEAGDEASAETLIRLGLKELAA